MSLGERSSPHEVAHTARLLGRLYDVVECHGLSAALVQRLCDAAGIVVYDALGANELLLSALAMQLGNPAELARNRRFALQALYGHGEGALIEGIRPINPLDVLDIILLHRKANAFILDTWTL